MQQSLSGIWKLRPEFLDVDRERYAEVLSRKEGKFQFLNMTGVRHPKPFPKREGFLNVNVPCDVITALIDNEIIPEPLERDNTERLLWLMDFSWWFIHDFDVSDELYAHEQVRLFIEILDYKADIILNGIPAFTHKNAFVPFTEDIKRYLHPGRNKIIIRLWRGGGQTRRSGHHVLLFSQRYP